MAAEAEVTQSHGIIVWAINGLLALAAGLLGLVWRRHEQDIEELKRHAHTPDHCPMSAHLGVVKVDKTDFDRVIERMFDQAKKDRDEVLGEIRSLGKKVDDLAGSRPSREEVVALLQAGRPR